MASKEIMSWETTSMRAPWPELKEIAQVFMGRLFQGLEPRTESAAVLSLINGSEEHLDMSLCVSLRVCLCVRVCEWAWVCVPVRVCMLTRAAILIICLALIWDLKMLWTFNANLMARPYITYAKITFYTPPLLQRPHLWTPLPRVHKPLLYTAYKM